MLTQARRWPLKKMKSSFSVLLLSAMESTLKLSSYQYRLGGWHSLLSEIMLLVFGCDTQMWVPHSSWFSKGARKQSRHCPRWVVQSCGRCLDALRREETANPSSPARVLRKRTRDNYSTSRVLA